MPCQRISNKTQVVLAITVLGISLRPITADSPKISPVLSLRSRAPDSLVHFLKFFIKTASDFSDYVVAFFFDASLAETAVRTSAPLGLVSHLTNE